MKNVSLLITFILISVLLIGCSTTPLNQPVPSTMTPTFAQIASPIATESRIKKQLFPTEEVIPTLTDEPTAIPISPVSELNATPLTLENTPFPLSNKVISAGTSEEIVPLTRFGKGNIKDFAYSMDGKLLGIASSMGLYIYQIDINQITAFYPTESSATSIKFSPDGVTFAAGFSNGTIEFREIQDGKMINILRKSSKGVMKLAFIDDGIHLVSVHSALDFLDAGGEVIYWDIQSSTDIQSKLISTTAHSQLSSDGRIFAYFPSGGESALNIVDPKDWRLITTVPTPEFIYFSQLSPSGDRLLFDFHDSVSMINIENPIDYAKLDGIPLNRGDSFAPPCHLTADGPGLPQVDSGAFSTDGDYIILGTGTGIIQIRNASSGAILSSFEESASKILISPKNQSFVLLSEDGRLQVRNIPNGHLINEVKGFTSGFLSISFAPNGQYLAAGATDPFIRIWNMRTGEKALDFQAQGNRVAYSPDGSHLAVGSAKGGVFMIDPSTGDLSILVNDHPERQHLWRITSMEFSDDGRFLIYGSQACFIEAWDINSKTKDWRATSSDFINNPYPIGPIESIAWIETANQVAILSLHNSFIINPLDAGSILNPTKISSGTYIQYLVKSKSIVIGASPFIERWNMNPSKRLFVIEGPGINIEVSPDETLMATSDEQGTIYLWAVEDGELLFKLKGHRDEITQMTFSKDGKYLASASSDGTIRIWGIPYNTFAN